jgi:hypothetical protein
MTVDVGGCGDDDNDNDYDDDDDNNNNNNNRVGNLHLTISLTSEYCMWVCEI